MSQKADVADHKGRLERFKQWILPPNDPNAPIREDIRFMPTRLGAFFLNPPKASPLYPDSVRACHHLGLFFPYR